MKTNHSRSFKARQDFQSGWRGIAKSHLKLNSARNFRAAVARSMIELNRTADPEAVMFPYNSAEVTNRWCYD